MSEAAPHITAGAAILEKLRITVQERESSFRELGTGGATSGNASGEQYRVWRSQRGTRKAVCLTVCTELINLVEGTHVLQPGLVAGVR